MTLAWIPMELRSRRKTEVLETVVPVPTNGCRRLSWLIETEPRSHSHLL
jgi:hypothetical protein